MVSDDVCLTELPAFVLSRTAKQTASCQSAGDEPQKCVRLFRYSYRLPRKSILNLANRIFADLCHVRGRKSRNRVPFITTIRYLHFKDIEKASHTLLAHHLLIYNVQSVWMSAVKQRLVIQFSRYGHFYVKLACVASVSVEFESKERPRNGVFGILPARKMGRELKEERWG